MRLKAGTEVIDVLALAHASDQPVLIEGTHGVGKSQLIEQAASQLGVEFIVRDLSLMEPPDLIGLPIHKSGQTVYAPPAFLPASGRGFLVFEELNRSEKYMRSPCLQLLTARCLNDYRLPHGWLPVAAINPSGEAYDVQELDPALLSRFMRIEVTADVAAWIAWAERNGIHPGVRQYVSTVADIFDSSNPRSWAYVSNVVIAHEANGSADRRALMAAVAGLVGDTHATAFLKMYRSGDAAITADSVLRKYKKVKSIVSNWATGRKTDQLQSIAHSVLIELQRSDLCAEIRDSVAMTKNLEDFLHDLPADIGRKVRTAAKNGGAIG